MTDPRVTIAFCSGRRLLVPVVDMLVGRLRALGYGQHLDLRLLVVWDRAYEGEAPPGRELGGADVFTAVRCVLAADGGGVAEQPPGRGYAGLRNRAVAEALDDGADVLLMLDDDEYFIAPWRGPDGGLRWRPVDPLGPHLQGFALGADVTNGFTLGEPSPIPRGLPDHVPPGLLRRLGRALAPGSEFLHEEAFLSGRLCLAPAPVAATPIRRVAVHGGVHRLSGGNLGLRLSAARSGLLPPFYAPPFARGEDALFGARVGHLRALRVPAFVYHDPFRRHVDITAGARPRQLTPASLSPASAERFGRALLGWVRYAPLLLRLRAADTGASCPAYETAIDELHAALEAAAPKLVSGLGWEGFAVAPTALVRSHRRSAVDLEQMGQQEVAWRETCVADAMTAPPIACAA